MPNNRKLYWIFVKILKTLAWYICLLSKSLRNEFFKLHIIRAKVFCIFPNIGQLYWILSKLKTLVYYIYLWNSILHYTIILLGKLIKEPGEIEEEVRAQILNSYRLCMGQQNHGKGSILPGSNSLKNLEISYQGRCMSPIGERRAYSLQRSVVEEKKWRPLSLYNRGGQAKPRQQHATRWHIICYGHSLKGSAWQCLSDRGAAGTLGSLPSSEGVVPASGKVWKAHSLLWQPPRLCKNPWFLCAKHFLFLCERHSCLLQSPLPLALTVIPTSEYNIANCCCKSYCYESVCGFNTMSWYSWK